MVLIPTYKPPTSVPLPEPGRRNILVTSALPYVNNEPHLGNIVGCVLSADAFARYARLRGHNVLYIGGTDEYGTATETKALEEGISCQELCDKYNALHTSIYDYFDIATDKFGRTTTPQQTEIAQDIFDRLHKRDQLVEQTTTQLYCETCTRFLADRYVEGTCPHCGFEDARGDQCDNCQKLLNASDLIKPRCKLDGATPVHRESTHLYLNLPELQEELAAWVEKSIAEGKWSSNAIAVTRAWLKEGLKPRCITRDLKWGTPVPLDGFRDKVFYVWFDAPIGYLSITATLTPEWEKWWKNPENVQLYQFMGKDNVPFHTVIFPSSLLGTGEKWTLLNHLSTTEYLNYEGGKFSKSRKTGVFGSQVRNTGIDIAVWRYYLFANRPETSDADFSWKDFIIRNNSELLNNVGNFVNRVVKFAVAKYGSKLPAYTFGAHDTDKTFVSEVNTLLAQYVEALDAVKIRHGLHLAMAISARGNQYLQDNKLDNNLFNNVRERCDNVVAHALNLAYLLSALFYPYMPSTSEGILRQLQAPQPMIPDTFTAALEPGHALGKSEYLFNRIDEKLEAEFRAKYGGGSAGGDAAGAANGGVAAKKPVSKRAALKSAAAQDPVKILAKLDPAKVTDKVRELQAQVAAQGEKVKELKTAKADATQTAQAVEGLLTLKQDLLKELQTILAVEGNGSS